MLICTLHHQIQSSEVGGQVTIAFLPTMNIVSGLLQDGELSHDHAVKVRQINTHGTHDLMNNYNPLTPRVKPWVRKSVLTFDSTWTKPQSVAIHWEAVLYCGAVCFFNFTQFVILEK